MSRAQMSVEYLLILAFVIAILVPGVLLYYTYSKSSSGNIKEVQLERIGQEMIDTAERAGEQGEGSWLSLDANLPQSVRWINVTGADELTILYEGVVGLTEAVFFSDEDLCANTTAPISNSCNQGSVFVEDVHGGHVSFQFTRANGFVGIKEVRG